MRLSMRPFFVSIIILAAQQVSAEVDVNYLTIKNVKVQQISYDVLNQEKRSVISDRDMDLVGIPENGFIRGTDKIGKVIATAGALVALGENLYTLVQYGRPTIRTNYAPISVIPKIDGIVVDIMETEGWKLPIKRTYEAIYTNLYGMEVVKFRYSVIFSYGGSHNGKGAYLTAAQIVPDFVSTLFGYDFSADMKLAGIQNFGNAKGYIAGAILQMEHTVSTVIRKLSDVKSFQIIGDGRIKKL